MNGAGRGLLVLVGVLFCAGCASAPPDASVRVYQADAGARESARRMPDGCRLLRSSPPVDQMESERHADDPYRVERRETAAAGGNVLLVLSEPLVVRASSDCPSGDRSSNCLRGAESWYRVVFESYACVPEALATLPDTSKPVRAAAKRRVEPARSAAPALGSTAATVAPDEMKRQILAMKSEGIGVDVILAYVRRQRLSRALTADEIIDWKKAGIEEAVLAAAAER